MSRRNRGRPGTRARPDNQGDTECCTAFAVSKAVVECLDELDLDTKQDSISAILTSQDTCRKYADEFDGVKFKLQCTKRKDIDGPRHYGIALDIEKCNLSVFVEEHTEDKGKFVVDYRTQDDYHSMYAKNWDGIVKKVYGINSWGRVDSYYGVNTDDIRNIYRVRVRVKKNGKVVAETKNFGQKNLLPIDHIDV